MIFQTSKNSAAELLEEFPLVLQVKGGLDINMSEIKQLTQGGAQAAVELGIGFDEDLASTGIKWTTRSRG
jgi:RNA-splicing ligase RtcB